MGAPCAMVRWIPRTKRGPWTLPPCWDTKRKHGREEQPDLFWCFKGAGAMWNIWIFSEYLKSESQNIWSAGLSQQLGTGNFLPSWPIFGDGVKHVKPQTRESCSRDVQSGSWLYIGLLKLESGRRAQVDRIRGRDIQAFPSHGFKSKFVFYSPRVGLKRNHVPDPIPSFFEEGQSHIYTFFLQQVYKFCCISFWMAHIIPHVAWMQCYHHLELCRLHLIQPV